jgi:hypothetical protein
MRETLPPYKIDSASLKKFRWLARNGLKTLTRAQVLDYARAVEAAILSAQRSECRPATPTEPRVGVQAAPPIPRAKKSMTLSEVSSGQHCLPIPAKAGGGARMENGRPCMLKL